MKLKLLSFIATLSFSLPTTAAWSLQTTSTDRTSICTRRSWLYKSAASVAAAAILQPVLPAFAEQEEQETYDNPNIPAGPEEKSGLVVLRVAEVAQFQEKILRAIRECNVCSILASSASCFDSEQVVSQFICQLKVNGEIKDVVVTPQQLVFGTQILMRNSNLAGNMKLMIDNEIPRNNQRQARIRAANTMNALQKISSNAAKIERELSPAEYDEFANLYRLVRVELNGLYELLAEKERNKYYGYFVAVTEYEKKIAEGVYNPDIDGVLKFD